MGDLSQLRREYRDLATESAAQEEQAKYELTTSARRFSRRARHVVDDKLSFSATLMRAGEVDAANRLLEEVHQDVRTEEAALIEKMNEVKVARAAKRESMTRVRLARMVTVSLVGSLLMGFSALGMAAAGFVENREQDQIRRNAIAQRRALEDRRESRARAARRLKQLDSNVRKLLLAADLPVGSLTPAEVRKIGVLTDGTVDVGALEQFLVGVLESPDLAAQVASRIATEVDTVTSAAGSAVEEAPSVEVDGSRLKRKAAQRMERSSSTESSDEETSEPSPSPSPEETESPSDDTETTDETGKKRETGGDGNKKGGSGEGNVPGGEGLPLDGDF